MVLAVVAVISAVAFVDPPVDRPQRADAIVVLGGDGARVGTGLRLFDEGWATTVLLSVAVPRYNCPKDIPAGMHLICFVPHPFTTQGEARFLAATARAHHWTTVLVVSGRAQTLRAKLRVQRCWGGRVLMVPAPQAGGLRGWYDVAYEWGATIKALVWQRGC